MAKALNKAIKRLNWRIAAYDAAKASSTKIGGMANKPGSMKIRK